MAGAITIRVQDQGVAAMFRRLAQLGKEPRELTLPAARDIATLLKRHYRENERLPVKHPGAKKHFWREVLLGVQTPVEHNGGKTVVVSINHPAMRQKYAGGTISAKRVRFLTIPVTAEAYDAGRASVFEYETGLKLFPVGGSGSAAGALATRNDDGSLSIHYLLRRSVKQEPEPRALPPVSEMLRVAMDRMRKRLELLIQRARGK